MNPKVPTPPGWARWLLTWLHPEGTLEEVEGDLDELYTYWYHKTGKTQATLRYLLNVLSVLPPFVRQRQRKETYPSSTQYLAMICNYLKIAFRNLSKNRLYSAINIVGLTSGLAVGLLILLWVKHEMGYDRFHQDTGNIYRVLTHVGKGESRQIWSHTHAPLATFAKAELPEVRNAVRIRENRDVSLLTYGDKQLTGDRKAYVDPAFFTVFDFKLDKGSPNHAVPGQPIRGVDRVNRHALFWR